MKKQTKKSNALVLYVAFLYEELRCHNCKLFFSFNKLQTHKVGFENRIRFWLVCVYVCQFPWRWQTIYGNTFCELLMGQYATFCRRLFIISPANWTELI